MKTYIDDLIEISHYAGNRVDYTQGGGGNTSVKNLEKGIMLIKASGYKLKDLSPTSAFVGVNLNAISNYYNSVDLSVKKDYEKESAELSKNSVVELEGIKTLRPSVEVGFHSILKKYVIHTHSVYANLITCSNEGENIAKNLFFKKDYGVIFLPYINPGFELTLAMMNEINKYVSEFNKFPEVIFMKNHGLVVTSDDKLRVQEIHTDVNKTIAKYFNIENEIKEISMKKVGDSFYSETNFITEFIKNYNLNIDLLNEYPLYPDQLVYLNNILVNSPETIKFSDDGVVFNTDTSQATTLHETLFAYAFVIDTINKNKLTISKMNEKEVAFINGWEAEKYRRSVK